MKTWVSPTPSFSFIFHIHLKIHFFQCFQSNPPHTNSYSKSVFCMLLYQSLEQFSLWNCWESFLSIRATVKIPTLRGTYRVCFCVICGISGFWIPTFVFSSGMHFVLLVFWFGFCVPSIVGLRLFSIKINLIFYGSVLSVKIQCHSLLFLLLLRNCSIGLWGFECRRWIHRSNGMFIEAII